MFVYYEFSNRKQIPGAHPPLHFLSDLAKQKGQGTGGWLPVTLPLALDSSWSCEAHPSTDVSAGASQSCLPSYAEDSRSTLTPVSPTHHPCPWQPSTTMGITDSGRELGLTPKHSLHARRGLGPLRISLSIECLPTLGIFPWSNCLYEGK